MGLSIFLAKLIGIYLLVVAADLLMRRKELEAAVRDFAASKGLLAFSGSLSLLFGLIILLLHPVFSFDWRGILTLFGCLLVLRGVIRVAFPSHLQKTLSLMFHQYYWAIILIITIIGAFFTYCGFTALPELPK